jgi:integrase
MKKGKPIFYVQFYDESGVRLPGKSSGQTTKGAAETWAWNELKQGNVGRKDLKFPVFAENWFDWDRCEYLKRERSRRDYSRHYADIQKSQLENHIMPAFKILKLSQITVERIEKWVFRMREKTSAATANRCLSTLKVMLKEAERLGYIAQDPSKYVKKLQEFPKEKGLLTPEEVKKLFKPESFKENWANDLFHYAFNILAATTGMRMGEVQALQRRHVHDDYVRVEYSWSRKYGLVEPKGGSKRYVSLPKYVSDKLQELMNDEPNALGDKLVFQGLVNATPMDHKAIAKHFHVALQEIEISEEDRIERNITFHSWRHFFNTFMRGKVSDVRLRKVTGHKTEAMTDHYDHVTKDALKEIRGIQEEILLG